MSSGSIIKEKLMVCIKNILSASSFPPLLCSLCVKCSNYIENSPIGLMEKENGDIMQWCVSSLIFLRCLVPSITSLALDDTLSDQEKKGAVILGRFLMKLSCRSTFQEYSPNCLLNELLRDCAQIFDRFCIDVVLIGSNLTDHFRPLTDSEYQQHDYIGLNLYLSNNYTSIAEISAQISEKDHLLEKEKCGYDLPLNLAEISDLLKKIQDDLNFAILG